MSDFGELLIQGRVATPDDSDWDEVRAAKNLAADQRPAAVALVEGAEDVVRVVRFAAENGLKVSAQTTGHAAGSLAPLADTILIKTERMRGVEVDPEAQTARVEAGVLGSELGAAAGEHGLCFLPGSSPTVGVTGYTLGGGLGWLGRRHGFACNRVAALDVVTADGERRRVSANEEPDLFWALRGGGGGYAVVCGLDLELLTVAEVYAGMLVFPAQLGADAIRAYRDWAARAPDTVTSTVRFLRPPPLPTVPEPIRGKELLAITATCIGSEADGERAVAPLRELGEPIIDTFAQIPTSQLSRINMDPEDPVPSFGHHAVVAELPDEAINALVEAAGVGSGTPLLLAELRQLGGAFARAPDGAGALEKLDGEFVMVGIGVPVPPNDPDAIKTGLDRLYDALEPWAGDGGYLNFAERPADLEAILPAETCSRLSEVKRRWDPEDVIVSNHALAAV
jgi:hypothetical protein